MLTSNERKCVWSKYIDPLNANIEEMEWPGFDNPTPPENIEFYDFSDTDVTTVKDIDRNFFENLGKKIHGIKPVKIINTKMGLLTVTENAVADYHFDFWILHTNFAISEEIVKIICESPGVDAFIPMTRYRCKIGFPKSGLFNITSAKLEIQKRLLTPTMIIEESNSIFPNDIKDKIDIKINELRSRGKHWALYVLPNGAMEILESESIGDTFNSKLKIFEGSQKLAGGHVFRP